MSVDQIKTEMELKIMELTLKQNLDCYNELCNKSTIHLQKKNEDVLIGVEMRLLETIDLIEKYHYSIESIKKLSNDTIGAIFENRRLRKD